MPVRIAVKLLPRAAIWSGDTEAAVAISAVFVELSDWAKQNPTYARRAQRLTAFNVGAIPHQAK
jgi:hypothetical protein